MNISQILLMLEKEIKESNYSSEELTAQKGVAGQISNQKLKAPKSKKDKLKDKKKKDDEAQKDEDALDVFDKEIQNKVDGKGKSKDSEEDEDDYDDVDMIEDEMEEEKEKEEFKLEDAKDFSKFMDLVNNFRASSSLRSNPKVKEFYNKLKEGEKQAICIFFSALEKVANFEDDVDFKMPKSPTMLGLTITSTKSQEEKKELSTIKKASSGDKKADKELSSITPIKVGSTNENRYYSIDSLLKEIK